MSQRTTSQKKTEKRERRHARIRSRVTGTHERPRVSVHRSNTTLSLQLINDESGTTLASASTKEVKTGTTREKAVKAGALLAERAQKEGVKKVVFDRSGYVYAGKVKAAAEGARDAGLIF